jgi:hypothetical protein
MMQIADTLQATRPSRESKTGWTQKSQNDFSGSHDFLKLNERGPALNVFWSRLWREGRKAGERAGLPKAARAVKKKLPKKIGPEGAGAVHCRPLLSDRKVGQWSHQPPRRQIQMAD